MNATDPEVAPESVSVSTHFQEAVRGKNRSRWYIIAESFDRYRSKSSARRAGNRAVALIASLAAEHGDET